MTAANVDISHYTGVANISVPLHSVAGKDMSIPVSLFYQTTGIKVQDVASPVGLGWGLNGGSFAVTRVVRGLPDGSERFCNTATNGKIERHEIWETHFNTCDAERDIFYFSTPSRNGKMFLDAFEKPQTIPYQDLRISPAVGSQSIGYWKIVDESGYTYYFGETFASREETTYSVGNYATDVFSEMFTFISTWYLTRIVSSSGSNLFTFSYNPGTDLTYFRPAARVLECNSPPDPVPTTRIDSRIKIESPKYIASISSNMSSCVFEYDDNRQDVSGALRLASVSFKDDDDNVVRKFHLTPGCFATYDQPTLSCYRFKLESIAEGVANPVTTHSFIYNESGLPHRMSFYTDHYGYFNVNSSDGNTFPGGGVGYPDRSIAQVPTVCSTGRNKDPNSKMLNGILTEIHHSSGARTVFAYDVAVGARVASISYYDQVNLVGRSTFTYTGETYKSPIYHYYNIENSNSLIRSSNAYNSVFDLNGVNKAYPTVVETLLDDSKVERQFYGLSDFPDEPPVVARYRGTTNPTFQATSNIDSSPFTPYSSRAWMRGLPKFITVFDAENYRLKREEFVYEPGDLVGMAWSMAVEAYRTVPGDYGFYVGDYHLKSEVVSLASKKTYLYDQSDFNRSLVETTVFDYHETHRTFPKSVVSYVGNNGPETKMTLKYPVDLTGDCVELGTCSPPGSPDEAAGGVWSLAQKHVIRPIETLMFLKDWGESTFKIIGGELYTFKEGSLNQPILTGAYKLDLASPVSSLSPVTSLSSGGTVFNYDNSRFRLLKSFSFDETNDILDQATDHTGIVEAFEYGYSNSLVTATSLMAGGVPQYREEYSYNTVNGLESMIDANGIETKYIYDRLGRLKLRTDGDDNIHTRYRYNIANDGEFTAEFSVSHAYRMIGQSIDFICTENGETSGITRYVWDFGDGQVLEQTTGSVSHAYSTAGVFTAKLSKINPEYGTVMASQLVTTYSPPSVYIDSSCGPIDLCANPAPCQFAAVWSGGCSPPETYQWHYSTNAGSTWTALGSTDQISFGFNNTGTYLFKCVIKDECDNSSPNAYSQVIVYKSDPNCF